MKVSMVSKLTVAREDTPHNYVAPTSLLWIYNLRHKA